MKKIVSLMLTVVLCLACAVTVFADTEYKVGRDVEFSGQTNFDYFYTYTDKDVNYKCFSVVSAEGQRFYAAVRENLYEYYRATFAGQSLTLNGAYQRAADDGSPVIKIRTQITFDEKGKKVSTLLDELLVPVLKVNADSLDFQTIYDVFDDSALTVANDGSYITFDTNPYNFKDSFLFTDVVLREIKLANQIYGLPDWLYEEMVSTKALDGRQKESFDRLTVTWTYSPNTGLEVTYRKNN